MILKGQLTTYTIHIPTQEVAEEMYGTRVDLYCKLKRFLDEVHWILKYESLIGDDTR